MEVLGREARGELGGLTTVEAVLAAARGEAASLSGGDGTDPSDDPPDDPAAAALRRAARLRAEALAGRS